MDKLSDRINLPQLKESSKRGENILNEKQETQLLTSHHMVRLWAKMARIYAHKWTSASECDDGTWLEGLRGYTQEEVAYGLSGCLTRDNDWPPDLPEFRKLCRPEHIVTPACHKEYKSLPKPDADPEVARKSIASMKRILKHGFSDEDDVDSPLNSSER